MSASLSAYRGRLLAAYEVHGFNKDVDDTSDRIAEKATMLSSADNGKDLTTVEALLRLGEGAGTPLDETLNSVQTE